MKIVKGNWIGYCLGVWLVLISISLFVVPKAIGQPAQSGIVGDFVWNDLDQDGIQDVGEPGVANILVDLNYYLDNTVVIWQSTYTDSDGKYYFEESFNANVTHFLEFTLPDATWNFSPANQGTDDAFDSDVAVNDILTGVIEGVYAGLGSYNNTYDAGIYQQTPVPEPTTMLLLGAGLIGLAVTRRKMKK